MVAREKNQDKSSEEMEGKLSQIQEQLQKLMECMVNINDRNVQTDKELMELKQALGNAKQKDKEMDQNRDESFVGGNREQGFCNAAGNFQNSNGKFLTRCSKLDFPRFSGSDLRAWLYKVDQFFAIDEVPYDQRKSRNSVIDPSWSEYVLAVNERFGEEFEDSMEALKNLQQTEDVLYQAEFDRLLNGVNLSNENAEAKLQEEVFDAQAKSWGIRNSRNQNGLLPTPSRFQGVQKPTFSSITIKKPYEPNANRFNNGNTGRRLLTAAEMNEKRAKKLCFLCDEKYMPGHVCKSKKQLYLVEVLEDGEVIMEEDVLEVDECMTISLQAFTGSTGYQTIRVTGYHEKQPLQVLIDTVSVADGRKVQTAAVCKNLKWLLQGTTFSSDFLLLPLGNVDIVLGVQWLNTLGRILFDFRNRTIEFVHLGRKHVLRGASSQIKTTKTQSLNKKSVDLVQVFMLTLVTDATSNVQSNSIQVTQGTDIHPTLTVLMEQYKCLFDMPSRLPPYRGIFDHKIPLIDSATPVNKRP
ncbi:uncharacterized protein [Solanum tuberosum]|uniref:uncharacterized protein n=1 Tax=Solanum tuberosum TaxID=4113 RepID=UPI00073A4199|nr:PREDICTED: uncharacterized protein LOC107062060 [Solanum tuberosum]